MASDLGVPLRIVGRVNSICRRLGKAPSQARLCVCALNHPDITDDEVAELFGRSVRWVEDIRARRQEIRDAEPFPDYLEYLDDGYQMEDPTPWEIKARCDELKALWIDGIQGNYIDGVMPFGRAAQRLGVSE